jgi:DNA-binding transcriptional LysR family regulator
LSAAACELGFSQPAVSYQLRSLEREVGTVLVRHHGRTALRPDSMRVDAVAAMIGTLEAACRDHGPRPGAGAARQT